MNSQTISKVKYPLANRKRYNISQPYCEKTYQNHHNFMLFPRLALIMRNRGELTASLDLLKDLHGYNEANYDVLKQIARSMFVIICQLFVSNIC